MTHIYTLGELLRNGASLHPQEMALIFPDKRTSYADLNDRARLWAAALIARGVQPGDHVGILLTTRPEFVEVKRLVNKTSGKWWVAGDNESESTDSRDFGAIEAATIKGIVIKK
jgi:long-subunit acyl-CoA synthetase (AMP-forming)